MNDPNSGNERIKALANNFYNNNVTKIQESQKEIIENDISLSIEYMQNLLRRYGLSLKKIYGGYRITELDNSPLKPGWIELPKFGEKYGYNQSKLRQLIGGAPEAIKRKIGRNWVVQEDFFTSYVRSCYKYG